VRRPLLLAVAALVLAPAALADGGPDPGVLEGGSGITNGSGTVRTVTVPVGVLTLVETVDTRGGRILRSTLIRGAGASRSSTSPEPPAVSPRTARPSCSARPAPAPAPLPAARSCADRRASW
jgi:hypothetical protein